MAVTKVFSNVRGWPAQTQTVVNTTAYNFDFNFEDANVWPDGVPADAVALVEFLIVYAKPGTSTYHSAFKRMGSFRITAGSLEGTVREQGNSPSAAATSYMSAENLEGSGTNMRCTLTMAATGDGYVTVMPCLLLVQESDGVP